MKKTLSLIIIASLLLLSLPVFASGETLFKEDFNAMTKGEAPSGSWSLADVTEGKSKIIISERPDKKGDLCLDVYDNDTEKSAVAVTKIPVQTGDFTYTYEYYLKAGSNQPSTIAVMKDGAWPPAVTLMAGGGVNVFSGTENKNIKTGVEFDKWHVVTLHVYISKGSYDVYMDGEQIGADIKFRNPGLKEIDRLQLGLASVGTDSTCYYDNVEVIAGIKPVAITVQPVADERKIIPSATDVQNQMYAKIKNALVLFLNENNAFINGEEKLVDENIEVAPFTVDGRTLVPVRFIAESFNAKVDYDDSTKKVTIEAGGKKIELTLGSRTMTVNGAPVTIDVPADTYNDRTFIPLRSMSEAIGKKVFWDDRGLIAISDTDNIFNSAADREVLDLLESSIKGGREKNSEKKYSTVFYSTRIFRKEGTVVDPMTNKLAPKEGTINTARQMMITDDLWTYVGTDVENYKAMTDSGVSVQAAIGGMLGSGMSNDVYDKLATKTFEGNFVPAPWVTTEMRPYGASASDDFYEWNLRQAKAAIDKGIYSIQHDDWLLDVSSNEWGGGFYDANLTYFKEFLKRNYSTEQLKAFEIDNVDAFNYKTYLSEKLGIKTDAEYLAKRTQSKLYGAFMECAKETVRNYHIRLRKALNEYAGRTVVYSVNSPVLQGYDSNMALSNDIIDFPLGEANDGTYTARNIAACAPVMTAMGKTSVMAPIPKSVDAVKIGTAAAYAFGQFVTFPWDVYVDWVSPRYFGTTNDYAKEFHFIRQYEKLFNGYEIPASVGILGEKNSMSKADYTRITTYLFERGIPFKMLMESKANPVISFDSFDLKGLSSIVALSDLDKFSAEKQDIIKNSGINIVDAKNLEGLNSLFAAKAESSGTIYTVTRQKNQNDSVIHILNKDPVPVSEISLTVNNKYIPEGAKAVYYRPGFDPLELTRENGIFKLPYTEFWGIVKISNVTEENTVPSGMTFINIGSPQRMGSSNFNKDAAVLTTKGYGLNLGIKSDRGSFDQIAYSYKNLPASLLSDFESSVLVSSVYGGGAAGVMERKNTASNSPFIALYVENNKLKLAVRDDYNKDVVTEEIKGVTLPLYVKLKGKGNNYEAFVSADGSDYGAALASKTVELGSKITGFFLGGNGEAANAEFKNQKNSSEVNVESTAKLDVKVNGEILVNNKYDIQVTLTKFDGAPQPLLPGDVTVTSSDSAIAAVVDASRLYAKLPGVVTIKAVCGSLSAETTINVVKPDPHIFSENFDTATKVEDIKGLRVNNNAIKIADKALVVTSAEEGLTSDAYFETPEMSGSVTYEFDFKAVFGNVKNDTGARVIYVGEESFSVCLIAGPGGFSYFFGANSQIVAPIVQDKWYKIKLVVNFNEAYADLYMDDVMIFEKGALRNARASAKNIWFGGFRVNPDTFYSFDNIKVYRN